MNPMWGAAAMSMSSFCVVSNALRLNLLKIHDGSHDKPIKNRVTVDQDGKILETNNIKEDNTMTKTMKIEGMMCMHCEATVKKALEALEGVAEAKVSHVEGTAVVELTKDVSDEALKAAVEAKDYAVLDIA
jgi:Cu2+-exporting ATPase